MTDGNPDVDHEELLNGFEEVLRSDSSESTRREYVRHAGDYLDWVDEHDFDVFDVRSVEVKSHLKGVADAGYAPGYLKIRRAAIRKLYHVASTLARDRTTSGLDDVDADQVGQNPAHPDRMTMDLQVMKKGSKQSQASSEDYIAVDKDDLEQMCENVPPSHAGGDDHRLLLKLMFYTGLRKSEVCKIKIRDFGDPELFKDPRSINIRAVKTETNRTVYYHPDLVTDLQEWVHGVGRDLVLGDRESQYLFPSPDMGPGEKDTHISHQHVNWVVKESAKNAGIQEPLYQDMNENTRWKITSHSLRHGMAEACLSEGMDLRTLAELMGHFKSDGTPAIETTTMYLRGIDTEEQYRQHGPPAIDT